MYFGLFLSPFILLFSVSVFYLVHALALRPPPATADTSRTVADVQLPAGVAQMQGRARVDALRPVLDRLGVRGEVDFIRRVASEHLLVIPVRLPDRDTTVSVDYEARVATVISRQQSLGDALVYLHKMPGPHNVDVRGNSWAIRAWSILADVTAYVLLFITVSGIYLWVALRAERRIGLALIAAGALTLAGLVYAIAA